MTTRCLLIRHASHDLLGNTLAGRTRDVDLNPQGREEASVLVSRLASVGIAALYVSPRLRARATAAPLAAALSLAPRAIDALDEVDFGEWTGRSFADLAGQPEWRTWCERRAQARPPQGESIAVVQRRVVALVEALRGEHPERTIALVSHGDVIKAALAHYLHLSLDEFERFDIAPASVSTIDVGDGWAQVKLVNDTGSLHR